MSTERERALEIALIGVLSAVDQQGVALTDLTERAKQLISLYPREALNGEAHAQGAVAEIERARANIEEGKRLSEAKG
ncbi:hypothetical protein [Pseudomonas mandelii]|uniref:hypothetical protein n=1 Tax=Pseudomonas mandelii TaxID=75612 RepID=UPI0011982A32|nr:hypothetical protein [Pseudomonas mandelii]TWS02807.1 hypothetical protein FJD35_31715 [Pseudomonas mandelii]